jgi:hypothetical protein
MTEYKGTQKNNIHPLFFIFSAIPANSVFCKTLFSVFLTELVFYSLVKFQHFGNC